MSTIFTLRLLVMCQTSRKWRPTEKGKNQNFRIFCWFFFGQLKLYFSLANGSERKRQIHQEKKERFSTVKGVILEMNCVGGQNLAPKNARIWCLYFFLFFSHLSFLFPSFRFPLSWLRKNSQSPELGIKKSKLGLEI